MTRKSHSRQRNALHHPEPIRLVGGAGTAAHAQSHRPALTRRHPHRHQRRDLTRRHGLGAGQLFLPAQGRQTLWGHQPQRLGRAHLDAGRARLPVTAEIALQGLGLGLRALEQRIGGRRHLLHHHRHGAVRTSHHTGFAADAARLIDLDATILGDDGVIGAGHGAGLVFTLAAQHRGGHLAADDDFQARLKIAVLGDQMPILDGEMQAALPRQGPAAGR